MRLKRREVVINHVVLAAFAAFALLPLLGVLLSAVTPPAKNTGSFSIPSSIALKNFGSAWIDGNFAGYMLSSLIVTVSVVALTVTLSVLAGFAFARMRFVGSSILFYLLLLGLTLPSEAFIIPLYFNLRSAGLTNTYWALILPQTAQSLAFAVFWMRNQFREFSGEVIEAARLDGARDFRLLWQVMVPTAIAPVMTMSLLVTMWTWNEFLLPLVMIVSDNLRTAPLGLAFFQGQRVTNYSLLSASSLIVAAPIVILYIVLQKRFISGVSGGSTDR